MWVSQDKAIVNRLLILSIIVLFFFISNVTWGAPYREEKWKREKKNSFHSSFPSWSPAPPLSDHVVAVVRVGRHKMPRSDWPRPRQRRSKMPWPGAGGVWRSGYSIPPTCRCSTRPYCSVSTASSLTCGRRSPSSRPSSWARTRTWRRPRWG